MKERRTRLKPDDDGDSGDDWTLTFGDLMMQLVCFFILLMSFSVMESMKARQAEVSLHAELAGSGILPAYQFSIGDISMVTAKWDDEASKWKAEIEDVLANEEMLSNVEIEVRAEGLVITIDQRYPHVFFKSGDAYIKKVGHPILDEIGKFIKGLSNDIRVRGHTDNRPISTPKFPSNWELSAARAISVLRHLQRVTGFPPDRFSAAGYGPYRPIDSNDTPYGRSRNRRVEIILLRTKETSSGQQ